MSKLNLDFNNRVSLSSNPTLRILNVHEDGDVTVIGELNMLPEGTHVANFYDSGLDFDREALLKVSNKLAELDEDWIARQNDKKVQT